MKMDQKGKKEEILGGAGSVLYLDLGVHTCKKYILINAFYILLYVLLCIPKK